METMFSPSPCIWVSFWLLTFVCGGVIMDPPKHGTNGMWWYASEIRFQREIWPGEYALEEILNPYASLFFLEPKVRSSFTGHF